MWGKDRLEQTETCSLASQAGLQRSFIVITLMLGAQVRVTLAMAAAAVLARTPETLITAFYLGCYNLLQTFSIWQHLQLTVQPDHKARQIFLLLLVGIGSIIYCINKYTTELKSVISNAGLAQGFKVSGWLLLLADNFGWSLLNRYIFCCLVFYLTPYTMLLCEFKTSFESTNVKLLSEKFWDLRPSTDPHLTFIWPLTFPDPYLTLTLFDLWPFWDHVSHNCARHFIPLTGARNGLFWTISGLKMIVSPLH